MEDQLFRLPEPMPAGAVLIGPPDWLAAATAAEPAGQRFSVPGKALAWLANDPATDAHGQPISRLVFLHQDSFAGQDGGNTLDGWLDEVRALRRSYLPILLHGNLPGGQLVRFFRHGLFDAITVPIDRLEWVNMLLRAEKRLELRQQSRLILDESGRNQELLRSMRRRLGGESVSVAGELLRAQDSLEAANRQLTDAMAELSLLYRFGRELSAARNWDKVLREMLQSLGDFVGAAGAALILRSTPGGSYRPRQTWHWEEGSWDQVLVSLQHQVDDALAESLMAPGIFSVEAGGERQDDARRLIALPLDHHDVRLGFFLLMFDDAETRQGAASRYLPFLQAVQLVLAEEVAGAQMLDRIRDIGSFNAQVLETVRSAIWVLEPNGRTVYCNRAGWEMLTGVAPPPMNPDEFLFRIGRGRRLDDVAADAERPELILDGRLAVDDLPGLVLAGLRSAEDGIFHGEGHIRRSGGESIPVMLQTSLMPGRAHEEELLVVVAEDLRETRKLESERIRSERLEGLVEMSATLAHEIRNPLMGLSAQAELLADQLDEDDPRVRYIEVITGEVGRINDTITRMLNYVRPYEPERKPADLRSLVADSLELATARADARDIDLVLREAPEPARGGSELLLDSTQIKQVLLNLLLNAIDASPAGAEVVVALDDDLDLELSDQATGTRRSCRGVAFEVRDRGPGIPEEDREKIFRPFFTTKSSGTGLGLPLCQKIVGAHGGTLAVARESDQTVFRVELPRLQAGLRAAEGNKEEIQ